MFSENMVEKFYDEYGINEWERLDKSAYGKLMFLLHTDFLDSHIGDGKTVLDAGCGSGRFGIYIAKSGSRVTMLDLSQNQLDIAREKCEEAGVSDNIEGYIHASVTDLAKIADDSFDTVVCYGAVFNYLHEHTEKALSELIRVTKSGGEILLSVNNRSGVLRALAIREKLSHDFIASFWAHPEEYGIYNVIETGNEPDNYPGRKQPPRHYFSISDMKALLSDERLYNVSYGAVPCILTGALSNAEMFFENKDAWETIVHTEKALYRNESMLDAGEFLLAKATVE